ncbi:MAG: amino acid ABC transporter permease, partial [Candidatus Adiutrix sp.]
MKPQMGPLKKVWPLWPRALWVLTLIFFAWLVFNGAVKSGYTWDWAQIPSFFYDQGKNAPGPLLHGLVVTGQIVVASLFLTFVFGLIIALARLWGGPVLSALARIYLEIVRNTPLLVQILLVYLILGGAFGLSNFWSVVLAISFFEAAYLSEIIRSGILAVSSGQWEAAFCLGFSTRDTFSKVILPQTAPMLLPPSVSLVITLVKDSALVSVLGVYDLTKVARVLIGQTYLALELWFTI